MRVRHAGLPAALLVTTLTLAACGSSSTAGGSGGPGGKSAAGGAVTVTATDTACTLSRTALTEGLNTFKITNSGSKTTEVYLYASGDKIVAEKENIGPGLTYELTAQVPAGSYQVACKPGQTGTGIRTAMTAAKASSATTADAASAKAVAQYRTYVEQQVDALVPLVGQFAAAVKAGDVTRAKKLYAPSRVHWEAIEPVAEAFGTIDPDVDLREADLESGQKWTGWHRIEKSLWAKNSTAGMAPVAAKLVADIGRLKALVPTAQLSVASIGNGAKELLDEVATSKVTGEEETYSHTDLVDFAANVAGARKAFDVLRPLVQRSNPALDTTLVAAFGNVDKALAAHQRGTGYVSYAGVDAAGRRTLAQVVDALGAPLSQLAAAATSTAKAAS